MIYYLRKVIGWRRRPPFGKETSAREGRISDRLASGICPFCNGPMTPRFGKRGTGLPTPEEHYRRLLGLPLGRRLFGPEINQAYKRAAKTAHPDAGGNEREFLELSKARDALMRRI